MASDAVDQRVARRLANDAAIRAAALSEAATRGLDALGPTSVARSAGLTTGAVYARHEDVAELIVDLWQSTCRSEVEAFVSLAVAASCGDPTSRPADLDRLTAILAEPPPSLVVGAEAMLVARRNRALAEEVHPDVVAILDAAGAGPSAGDPDRRARAALAVVIHLGLVLIGRWGPADAGNHSIDWREAFSRLAANFDQSPVEPPDPDVSSMSSGGWFPGPDDLDDDVTRSRLLHAAMVVIARSGVERATATRIARRAGLSHGAIYGAFPSKDALVADAVRTVSDRLGAADARQGEELVARSGNFGSVLAALYLGRLSDERRQWQGFRLECLAAARWSPEVAQALDDVLTPMLDDGAVVLGELFGSPPPVAKAQRRMVFAASPGYSLLDTVEGARLGSVEWWRSAILLGPQR